MPMTCGVEGLVPSPLDQKVLNMTYFEFLFLTAPVRAEGILAKQHNSL